MPRLSVIIVNYNVRHFLEQALLSALKAAEKVSTELIVVDNNSVDGSVEMMRAKFPNITLIDNRENTGFAKANNQGIRIAKGDYVLLLNPDTVVEEDTFEKCVSFMDEHPECGGLGVKMLDGKGAFLPESKRSFPSPSVSFYKAFGLSALFPRSKVFGKYHLGYLDEDGTHSVDVLAGAFMMLKKSVLDEIGLLDETFFMYGEDIDLSYRIVQAGYQNYYFPETRIIHYKGESTKKGSLNYVRMFYAAMKIFARKHFSGGGASLFILLINVAIYFRASLALLNRLARSLFLPLLDAVSIFAGMFLIKGFWEQNIKWLEGVKYPPEYLYFNVPLYILIWVVSVYLSGGYDRNARLSKVVRGLFLGTLVIAAIYGFLEEGLRFSRGMILSGALWAGISMVSIRIFLHFIKTGNLRPGDESAKRIVIAGAEEEAKRVLNLLNQVNIYSQFIGYVHPDDQEFRDAHVLAGMTNLPEIVRVFDVDEVIFCARDIASNDIISQMTRLGPNLEYKIVAPESINIIGSNSKDSAGDLYGIDINLKINQPSGRRNKRVLDFCLSVFFLITSPLILWFMKKPGGLFHNIAAVISGKRTWVGYAGISNKDALESLPRLRRGILSPLDELEVKDLPEKTIARLNLLYARDYEPWNDLDIIVKCFRELGRHE